MKISRISHRQLEQCHGNPVEWVSNKVNQKAIGYRSYNLCLRDGIHYFHRNRDVEDARQYTQKRILNQGLKNESRIQDTLKRLDAYMNWFQSERTMIFDSRFRLNFSLGHELVLGGNIHRVDIIPTGGYRAILLEEIPLRWEEELRMPLIQRALACAYYRPEAEFVVGIQELDASKLVVTSYSTTAIDHAEQIVRQLAEEVANEVAKYS